MASFELPDFYMPWPARANPHAGGARSHVRGWAHDVGILGSPETVWDARDFDAADFAGFTASVHPGAGAAELDLLTCWYVWLFYLDDDFAETCKRSGDLSRAKARAARLEAMMPVDPGTGTGPEPETVVETALRDLWSRTAPTASPAWRARFVESNRRLFDEFSWEIVLRREDRVANPIEYVEMRRRTGGTPWSADLVEHALVRELAPGIVTSPPIRVLRDVFADSVGLHNDIVSYDKELHVEDDRNNGVHIVHDFLRCELQQAVEVVNDLITSRLHHFEQTAATELEPLFAEHGLDPAQRADVRAYVGGLQDWMAGDREWHMSSGRYGHGEAVRAAPATTGPTGLGTAAARIAQLRPAPSELWQRAAGAHEAPQLYMPYDARVSPHLDGARERGRAWASEFGMLDGDVWDEARFDANDFALLAALTHPDAPAGELDLINAWNTWAFYADDLAVERFKRGRPLGAHDLAVAKLLVGRLAAFMPEDPAAASPPAPANALERALADLWSRLPADLPPAARRRFAADAELLAGSFQAELRWLASGQVPDAIAYVEARRLGIGAPFSQNLARYVRSPCRLLGPELRDRRPIRELLGAHADWQGLHNDIASFAREQSYDRDTNTGVVVLARLLGCDLQRAIELLGALADLRMRQFERIAGHELGPLLDELDVDGAQRADVLAYAGELRDWLAGAYAWSQVTGRHSPVSWTGDAAARILRVGRIGAG